MSKDIKADIAKTIFRIHAINKELSVGEIIYNSINSEPNYPEEMYPLKEYSDVYLLEQLEKYYETLKNKDSQI